MMVKNLLWQEVQTALVALLFAVLIWVYAEGENVQTHELTVKVRFTGPPGRPLVIDPSEPLPVRVRLRFAASQRAEVDALVDELRVEVEPTGEPGDPGEPGEQQIIDLRQRLRNHEAFASRGILVAEVQAEPMRVGMEPLAEQMMPVEVTARDLLLSPASAVPDTVKVSGPASRLKRLEGHRLQARLDHLAPGLPEGVPQEQDHVPLALPPGVDPRNIRLEPERVRVSFTIRRRTLEYTIPLVTVFPVYQENHRFIVEINPEDRTIASLVVEGPGNIIERIRRGEMAINPRADLLLTSDELDRAITEKVPEIVNLPPGLTLRSPLRPVRMRIARRDPVSLWAPVPLAPAGTTAAPAANNPGNDGRP